MRNAVAANVTECEQGSSIGALYLSIFVLGDTGSSSDLADWYLYKNPGGQWTTGQLATPGNTGGSKMRRFIFHEEKGIFATQDGTPMVFKGVIKIPPRFRRCGEDDTWNLKLLSPGTATFCVKCIYKEYR